MLHAGTFRATIRRAGENIPDGSGGWYTPDVAERFERVTVRGPSYGEREIAGRMEVKVSNVLDFRRNADVKIGDRIDVGNMPRLQVVAIPSEGMPGRVTKAVYCNVEGDAHGTN